MHINFEQLDPEFGKNLRSFLQSLPGQKLSDVSLLSDYISPFRQAILWKKGRSDAEIDEAISSLQSYKAYFLANIIINSPFELGPKVTDLLPGYSWQNWGKAIALKYLGDNFAGYCKFLKQKCKEYNLYIAPDEPDIHSNYFLIQDTKLDVVSSMPLYKINIELENRDKELDKTSTAWN
jgi:hypothetical protein